MYGISTGRTSRNRCPSRKTNMFAGKVLLKIIVVVRQSMLCNFFFPLSHCNEAAGKLQLLNIFLKQNINYTW